MNLKLIVNNELHLKSEPRGKLRLVASGGEFVQENLSSHDLATLNGVAKVIPIERARKAKKKNVASRVKLHSVDSSWINAVGYDQGTLIVETVEGRKYSYTGVEIETYRDFIRSTSPGRFFGTRIKGNYDKPQSA